MSRLYARDVAERVQNATGIEMPKKLVSYHVKAGYLENSGMDERKWIFCTELQAEKYVDKFRQIADLRSLGWKTSKELARQYGDHPRRIAGYNRIPREELVKKILTWEFFNPELVEKLYRGDYRADATATPTTKKEPEQKEQTNTGRCLFQGCQNEPEPGTEYGFRFCTIHKQNLKAIMETPRSKRSKELSAFIDRKPTPKNVQVPA